MPRLFALAVSVLLLLTACMLAPRKPAIALPPLKLAPATLGQTLALQQRLPCGIDAIADRRKHTQTGHHNSAF